MNFGEDRVVNSNVDRKILEIVFEKKDIEIKETALIQFFPGAISTNRRSNGSTKTKNVVQEWIFSKKVIRLFDGHIQR